MCRKCVLIKKKTKTKAALAVLTQNTGNKKEEQEWSIVKKII